MPNGSFKFVGAEHGFTFKPLTVQYLDCGSVVGLDEFFIGHSSKLSSPRNISPKGQVTSQIVGLTRMGFRKISSRAGNHKISCSRKPNRRLSL